MPISSPPIEDLGFVLHDVLRITEIDDIPTLADLDRETVDSIVDALARFAVEIVAPLNEVGDRQGARLTEAGVIAPDGFVDGYRHFVEAGWGALTARVEDGGQGLPCLFKNVQDELFGAANMAFAMLPSTSFGASLVLVKHGTDEMRRVYLPRLASGEWTAAMSLTEPQCGTALGLIRTRAVPTGDGRYTITGSKMFNTWGDHDMAENIVHLVLAKLPDAPAGTRGISLFLVPKYLPDADGRPGERNAFSCGSLERKLGIHGCATCVTNFDGATGWLVGAPNQGLPNMFVLMNTMRLTTGSVAIGIGWAAYVNALAYAQERIAGRSASGTKYPDLAGDPIIVHPDVRRMLLEIRAFAEGGRLFCMWVALELERAATHADPDVRAASDALVSLLTPIVKAYLSDRAFEAVDTGLQCFGGHGYIRDNGMEQLLRDERMLRLGEGTSGIQAMDLLGRKVLGDEGRTLGRYLALIRATAAEAETSERLAPLARALGTEATRIETLTAELGPLWRSDADEMGGASLDYLNLLGSLSLAFAWVEAALAAERVIADGRGTRMHENKLVTAEFYFARVLPETAALEAKIRAGAASLMRILDHAF